MKKDLNVENPSIKENFREMKSSFITFLLIFFFVQKVMPLLVKKKAVNMKEVKTATTAAMEMSSHCPLILSSKRRILKATSQKCSVKVIYITY